MGPHTLLGQEEALCPPLCRDPWWGPVLCLLSPGRFLP